MSGTVEWGNGVGYTADKDAEIVTLRRELVEATRERDDLVAGGEAKNRHFAAERSKYQARIEQLEAALPDPAKLDLLADWFDQDDANKGRTSNDPQVQRDLRAWARGIRAALTTEGDPAPKVRVEPLTRADLDAKLIEAEVNAEMYRAARDAMMGDPAQEDAAWRTAPGNEEEA